MGHEPADRSDEHLIERHRAGDPAAFRALFERLAPVVFRAMQQLGMPSSEARDIVQQTFLAVHRAAGDFRPGARLRPWLFTIAFNLARQHFRTRGVRREVPLDLDDRETPRAEAPDPGDDPEQTARRVREAIASLPPLQREVIVLHWLEGRPFAEVSAIVGASETAVKVRAHRGYERLRGLLAVLRNQ